MATWDAAYGDRLDEKPSWLTFIDKSVHRRKRLLRIMSHHHYVPEWHLRNFSPERGKNSGMVLSHRSSVIRIRNFEGVCADKRLNWSKDNEIDMESKITQMENLRKFHDFWKSLIDGINCEIQDVAVDYGCAHILCRTKHTLPEYKSMVIASSQSFMHMMLMNKCREEILFKYRPKDNVKRSVIETNELINQIIGSDIFKNEFGMKKIIRLMKIYNYRFKKYSKIVDFHRKWLTDLPICINNAFNSLQNRNREYYYSNKSFITSDVPYALIANGNQIWIPLSHSCGVMYGREGHELIKYSNNVLNNEIYRVSRNYVISPDGDLIKESKCDRFDQIPFGNMTICSSVFETDITIPDLKDIVLPVETLDPTSGMLMN